MSRPAKAVSAGLRPPGISRQFFILLPNRFFVAFENEGIAMPTIIQITHHRTRAATDTGKNRPGRIAPLGYRAWGELHKILTSDDFKAVAVFSGIGLLVGLLAMLFGVQ